jgi:hypothetical protein
MTMTETASILAVTDPAPRQFVAFGRLIGGLLVTTVGGFGLHYSNDPEINTFACVATVAGVVLNLWGFAGTVLHPKATAEDCFWAIAFFLLFCGVLAGNIYYNSLDYGLLAPGFEVAIAFAILVIAWMVAVATQILNLKNAELSKPEHRRRMLVAGVVTILVLWTFGRPIIAARYHVNDLVDSLYPAGDMLVLDPQQYAIMRHLPGWSVRWAIQNELESPQDYRVYNTLRMVEVSLYLTSLFDAEERIKFKNRLNELEMKLHKMRSLW